MIKRKFPALSCGEVWDILKEDFGMQTKGKNKSLSSRGTDEKKRGGKRKRLSRKG